VSDNESSRMRSDSFFIIRQFIPSSLHARLKCPVEVNRGIRVLNIGDHRGTLVTSREEGGGREEQNNSSHLRARRTEARDSGLSSPIGGCLGISARHHSRGRISTCWSGDADRRSEVVGGQRLNESPSSQRSPGNQACVALIGNCTPRRPLSAGCPALHFDNGVLESRNRNKLRTIASKISVKAGGTEG